MFEDDQATDTRGESPGPGEWKDDLQMAAAFLTRLPIKADSALLDLRRAARAFPIVGALIGLAGGMVLIICGSIGLSPLLAATFAIAALLILTGALHEDGLRPREP